MLFISLIPHYSFFQESEVRG